MVEKQELKADFKHIVRVANVDLQGEKTLVVALTKIKGVGMNLAHAICAAAKVDKHMRAGNMNEEQIKSLNQITSTFATLPKWLFNRRKDFETGSDMHLLTGNLTFYVDNDLKRMKKIKSYKGLRHQKGLTVRGQRTKSNFRRNKGKVVGVVKKKISPEAGDKGDKKGGDKKVKK